MFVFLPELQIISTVDLLELMKAGSNFQGALCLMGFFFFKEGPRCDSCMQLLHMLLDNLLPNFSLNIQ